MATRRLSHFVCTGLLVLAAGALDAVRAQTIYLRQPGTGFCTVTGASNATPIRLFVNNAAACGLADGAVILVTEVRGNTAANIHLEGPTDTVNLARKVANLSGNSFDLMDLADNPVPGNGAYLNGGRVGLASAQTLRPHPRLYLDGPGGAITTSVSDTGPTGRANAANLPWIALQNGSNSYNASGYAWGGDTSGNKTLNAALRWMVDGNAGARSAALFGLTGVDQVIGTLACDETERGCYAPPSSMRDYPSQNMETFSQAYSIMYSERTPAENAQWASFLLNDLPWSQGGIDYTGATHVKPLWKLKGPPPGTVTRDGATITGTGTSFLTEASVGDIIVFGHVEDDAYGTPYIITAINSDTELIVNRPTGNHSGNRYMIGPPWDPNFYGLVWHQKHFEPSLSCGGATAVPEGLISNCEENYGFQAGYDQSGSQNLVIARLLGNYAMGLAMCGDDPRGCLLLALANEFYVDVALPRALTIFTGFSQSTGGYHNWRMYNIIQSLGLMHRNSFTSTPDYLAGTDLVSKGARYGRAAYIPFLPSPEFLIVPTAEPYHYMLTAQHMRAALLGVYGAPQSSDARQFRDWLYNRFPHYTESFIRRGSSEYTWFHFLYNDPAATIEPASTTALFPTTNRASCVARYGTSICPADEGRYIFISNQNWLADRTYTALNGASMKCVDHCGTDMGAWPFIAKNGRVLLAGDAVGFMGERQHRGYIELGGTANNFKTFADSLPVGVLWNAGDDNYMVANLDVTQTFKPAVHATSVTRQWLHLKSGAQDYIIDHGRAVASTATMIRAHQHYHLGDSCGQPDATTCVSLDPLTATAAIAQPNARLTSKAFGIGSTSVLVTTESGNTADGTYTGGAGKSFRWTVCPADVSGTACQAASTEAEWVIIHKPSTAASDSLPPIVQSQSGAFRVFEIQDPADPKVALFTAGSTTATSAAVTTTHAATALYVVAGLVPGPYTVLRNGAELATLNAAEGANSISFTSASGQIEIVPGPPPMTVNTAALPNAVQGKPYSAAVSALGVPTPYQWQLVSGSLCAGLTFSQSGNQALISGSATALETCTFSLSVTNATMTETDSRQFQITVEPPGPPLEFVTAALPAGRPGDTYFARLQTSGGNAPVTWSLTAGSLCAGLALQAPTGEIHGTPAAIGNCIFTVRGTDLGQDFVERQLFIAVIPDYQTGFRITSARVSQTAAAIQFGRRGLDAAQTCSVELRLGGAGGNLLATLASAGGPSRRTLLATGLPQGQTIHATALCGAESATAEFLTGFSPQTPRDLEVFFKPPAGVPAVASLLFEYGPTPALGSSVTASCASGACSALISTDEPLLYWRATYRDAGTTVLATSSELILTPR